MISGFGNSRSYTNQRAQGARGYVNAYNPVTMHAMGMAKYTPGHVGRKQIGQTQSQWPASANFHAALRPFGM
jgi:hypothetical protein